MSKLDPMGPNPTNADIIKRLDQLHDCVESNQKTNLDANLILTAQFTGLSGQVEALAKHQNVLTMDFVDYKKVVAAEFGAAATNRAIIEDKVDGVLKGFDSAKRNIWRATGAISLVLLAGFVSLVVKLWPVPIGDALLTQHDPSRYTAADGQADRQAQSAINAEVLKQLKDLHRPPSG